MTDQPHSLEEVDTRLSAGVSPTIARGLDDWNNRLGRQFGPLSRRQRRALRAFHELSQSQDQVRVSDLADQLGVTSAGATRMVSKLEELGFLARFREPGGDQREVYVALTDAGTNALDLSNRVYFDRVNEQLACLEPAERETLARLLEKLTGQAR